MFQYLCTNKVQFGKLQTPVDMGVTAGASILTPLDHFNSPLTEPLIGEPQTDNSNKTNLQQHAQSHFTSTNPEVSSDTPLLLGYLDIIVDPEAKEPPEIIGTIHGQPA